MSNPQALQRHLVMHGLAVKKHGTAADVAAIAGLPPETAAAVLGELAATGRAQEADGKYVLSPLARLALEGNYSRFSEDLRTNPAFMRAYEDFERINLELKALITDWQVMPVGQERIANDHSDKEYDARIIDRLGNLHDRAEKVLAVFEQADRRFGYYRRELLVALEKAEDGAVEWVSDARLPSYHTLWFELHEDLLRIVGRQRVE